MKIIVKSAYLFFLNIVAFLAITGTAVAFRCGTSTIDEGDTKSEVVHKCGEPDYVDSWEEARISKDYHTERNYDSRSRSYKYNREPFLVKEQVKIEVWTYILGPTMFTRYLTFENGILTGITLGEKGY
jgi:hypothetical protein